MNSLTIFLLGALSIIVIVLITWLSANVMRAERVLLQVDKENNEIKHQKMIECVQYPYINTFMGFGYGHPFWVMRPRYHPYYVTV